MTYFSCSSEKLFNATVANSDNTITTVPTTLSTLNHLGRQREGPGRDYSSCLTSLMEEDYDPEVNSSL
ncbi:hypothetical protein GRJ2_001776500 [Grus japonensis]|uniref:Uncharacterized protein n=1 Tax=Grus japonensis TaxID=30415 RepID=A0ABC9X6Q5_GRUJA